MGWLQAQDKDSVLLLLHVQPRASRNRLAGLHGEALKLCLTAPPVDNKANKAVVRFLADLFGLPRTSVRIRTGQSSRKKQVLLNGIGEETARKRLQAAGIKLEA